MTAYDLSPRDMDGLIEYLIAMPPSDGTPSLCCVVVELAIKRHPTIND